MPLMNFFNDIKARVRAAPHGSAGIGSTRAGMMPRLQGALPAGSPVLQADKTVRFKRNSEHQQQQQRHQPQVVVGAEPKINQPTPFGRSGQAESGAGQSEGQFALDYPDYCWYAGLENRILAEYPHLRSVLAEHEQSRRGGRDAQRAVQLHRQLYKAIYLEELAKSAYSEPEGHAMGGPAAGDQERKDRAAYALFNLWANTPGDFSGQQSEFANYLEPYFIHSHIEFWSYYHSEHRAAAQEVLGQLATLAANEELGPIELLQVSMNVITLTNTYKADLALDKMIERGKLDEALYDDYLARAVRLIESDDDFHDATFDYVFTGTAQVHQMIDPQLERYMLRQLSEA